MFLTIIPNEVVVNSLTVPTSTTSSTKNLNFLSQYCVTCLNRNKNLQSLLKLSSDNVAYSDKLKAVIPQLVSERFDLNQCYSCENCLKSIDDCYDFYTTSLESKLKLEAMVMTEKEFACVFCPKAYVNRDGLNVHVKNAHKDEFRLSCEYCRFLCQTEKELREHLESKKCDVKFSFDCSVCSMKFTKKSVLEVHVRENHSGEKVYKCEECDRKYTRKNALKMHIREQHATDQKYPCAFCDKKFVCISRLKKHAVMHTSARPFVCECGETFNRKQRLELHQKKNQHAEYKVLPIDPFEETYKCELCGDEYTILDDLKKHVTRHSGETNSCYVCNEKFPSRQLCTAHIRKEHSKHRNFICHLCGRGFRLAKSLNDHINCHSGKKNYKCGTCGKEFYYRTSIVNHQKRHEGIDKRFQCPHCDRRTVSKRELIHHVRTHTGEKPHVCEQCGKGFATKNEVKNHVNSLHVAVKPYPCDICDKRFPTQNGLNVHKMRHFNHRPFACPSCPATYKVKSQLKVHMKKKGCGTIEIPDNSIEEIVLELGNFD